MAASLAAFSPKPSGASEPPQTTTTATRVTAVVEWGSRLTGVSCGVSCVSPGTSAAGLYLSLSLSPLSLSLSSRWLGRLQAGEAERELPRARGSRPGGDRAGRRLLAPRPGERKQRRRELVPSLLALRAPRPHGPHAPPPAPRPRRRPVPPGTRAPRSHRIASSPCRVSGGGGGGGSEESGWWPCPRCLTLRRDMLGVRACGRAGGGRR